MKNVIAYGVLFLLALSIVTTCVAGASLVGTAFGFPTILQTGTTTAFNRDTAAATDTEAFALSFPNTGETLIEGAPETAAFTLGFPTIAQTVDQTQVLTHCDFVQTEEEAAFSYPFVGVGGVAIPTCGFGF